MNQHEDSLVKKVLKYTAIGAFATAAAIGIPRSCTIVPAGHVTVLDVFGSVKEQELEPGLNWPINPFASRVEMETRTLEHKETMSTPTNKGLAAHVEVSVLYKINPSQADGIYKTLGTGYMNSIIIPNLRNMVRDVVANYAPEDLYSANRTKIAGDIDKGLRETYSGRGIILESILLRDTKLPKSTNDAIENKMREQQASEQMQYTLTKETQEAERKRVEATGIADAQKIIAGGLTQPYLQWKHIEMMREQAKSGHSTFVFAPYDQKLTPLINVPQTLSK